jgi:hypothetical protein
MENEKEESLEELEKKYYKNLSWYFSEKVFPSGFYNTVGAIRDELNLLNTNLKKSGESSSRLATALNRLTLWGVLVAAIGVLVAVGHLLLQIYKITHTAA